jgi:DNA-binding HxlR family transcriptional regulator
MAKALEALKEPPSDDRAIQPNALIDRSFHEFRGSAVRLAERVRDLKGYQVDPAEAAGADIKLLRTIFGKWSPEVLMALHAAPSIGFEALRRHLVGISPRVLSLKLKELEQNGMVHREIVDSRPPRVQYALTDRGWTVAWLAQPVLLYLRYTSEGDPSRKVRSARSEYAPQVEIDPPDT